MQKQFSIAEAKNKLPSIIHYIEKGPCVELTRRGKRVAILLSIQEYERLSRNYAGFWDALSAFRQNIHDEDIEISDLDFEGLRDTFTGREVELRG
ncbi:MAG: type II toxin-antitoxin system Phd/YefM family antitoxin [Deltaproteobacteria bacterium]|nr:type II toxin-antitoxin system Phd/YefM family antitoxin [Deltaproteobacteria bacterium]